MPNAKTMSKASTARMIHRRYQTAVVQRTRGHALEELGDALAQATSCASGTLTRIVGGRKEAGHVQVYAFDDDSILVVPEQGPAYVARNRHDREHFGRMLEREKGRKAAPPLRDRMSALSEEPMTEAG